ncbi:MAG: hypothetical protein ABSG46_11190, partial [Candidatus Binataceae bacterium]
MITMNAVDFAPDQHPLAARLAERLGDSELASKALRLVRERAPDEGFALAHLVLLADQTPAELRHELADPVSAPELIFCLGSSQIVASDLARSGSSWPAIFALARTQTTAQLIGDITFKPP